MDPLCPHCDEVIRPGDRTLSFANTPRHHRECFIRLTAGSAGHILKKCECYGGTEGDPNGLTVREAALAAEVALITIFREQARGIMAREQARWN